MAETYEVFVEGLAFFGHHGYHDFERKNGNQFLASVHVICQGEAPVTDDLEDTFDYSVLGGIIEGVNREENYKTLERMAGRICETVLEMSGVLEARVTLRKLTPPLDSQVESVGVVVSRKKDSDGLCESGVSWNKRHAT